MTMISYNKRRDDFTPTKDAWSKTAAHYRKLAIERASEGSSVQLACLVLADHCTHRWLGDCCGPTLEMIMLAENTVGESIDTIVVAALNEIAP
jgi:hypothetical protein